MAIQEYVSGSENLASGTEWSMTTDTAGPDADTTDGLFQLVLDLTDMADGESVRVRAYEKCRSGDTQRKVWESTYADAMQEPLIYSSPLILMHGWDFTITTMVGTVNCLWSIRSLAQTVTERVTGTHAIDTTEWSLGSDTSYDTGDAQTTDGLYQLFVDANDMTDGDLLQVREYEKCRSGDTQRLAYQMFLAGSQMNPMYVSPALCGMHGWDWTLDAITGTINVSLVDPNGGKLMEQQFTQA